MTLSSPITTALSREAPSARPRDQQPLDVGEEAEGTSTGQIAAERLGADIGCIALPADHRAREVDLDLDPHAIKRAELSIGAADLDANRPQNLQEIAWLGKGDDAGLVEGSDEAGGAAVQNRNFRAVDFNDGVVDAKGAEGRHQMLDRRDLGTVDGDGGAKVGGADIAEIRRDFAVAAVVVDVGAKEGDAVVGFGGMDGQRHVASAVNPNSRDYRTRGESGLLARSSPNHPVPVPQTKKQQPRKTATKKTPCA